MSDLFRIQNTSVSAKSAQSAFTLVELLVAAAVLALLVALLLNMVTQTSKTWKSTSGKIEEFRGARDSFDAITRHLQQATLNTYLDYVTNTSGVPIGYQRQSQLRFLSGPTMTILSNSLTTTNPTMAVFFQAPNGFSTNSSNSILQNALNTWGYFIEYASDSNSMPSFVHTKTRNRYRLMELMEPTENLSIYNYTTNASYAGIDWITNSLALPSGRPVHVVADNVIALIILPKLSPADMSTWNSLGSNYTAASLASNYTYSSATNQNVSTGDPNLNTHHQLPPDIQVTLIAVDEASAIRFPSIYQNLASMLSPLFTSAASYTNDLQTLQSFLSTNHMNFRVFFTDVMVKGAKWSGSQTN